MNYRPIYSLRRG